MSQVEDSDEDISCTLGENWGACVARHYRLNEDLLRETNILRLMRIPDSFICPISCSIMQVPVATVDGCIYEREFITQWIRDKRSARQPVTSPSTGLELPSTQVIPLVALQKAIETYVHHRPELRDLCTTNRSLETLAQLLQDELLEKQRLHQRTQEYTQRDASSNQDALVNMQEELGALREKHEESLRRVEDSLSMNQILRDELLEVRDEYAKVKNELDETKCELYIVKAVHACLPIEIQKAAAQAMMDNATLDSTNEPEADQANIKDVELVVAETRHEQSESFDLLIGDKEVLEPDQEPNSDEDGRKIQPAQPEQDKEVEEVLSPSNAGQEHRPLLDDDERRERNRMKKQKKKSKNKTQSADQNEDCLTPQGRALMSVSDSYEQPISSSSSSSVVQSSGSSSVVARRRPLINILQAACSRRPGGGSFLKEAVSKTVGTMKEMVLDVNLEWGSNGLEVQCRFGRDKDKDKESKVCFETENDKDEDEDSVDHTNTPSQSSGSRA